jgi:uncharacterized protein YqhQ
VSNKNTLEDNLKSIRRWDKVGKILSATFFVLISFLLVVVFILGPVFTGELALPEFPPAAFVVALAVTGGSLFILRRRRK